MEIILDAAFLGEKETAHTYLEEMLELPSYYGRNLDALHDCLSEMPNLTLIIRNAYKAGDYFYRLLSVMEDSCQVILEPDYDDSSDGDN